MSSAAPVIARTRRPFAPKVKTGCLRCKTRKVKCPEEKPQCSRCVRMGYTDCQYPLLSQPREVMSQVIRQQGGTLPQLAIYALARAPSRLLFEPSISGLDPMELTFLDRFRHRMILRVTALTFNDFWGRVILHETLADECVLDAVLALGALDQAWDQANESKQILCSSPSKGKTRELSCSKTTYRLAVQYHLRSVRKLRNRLHLTNNSPSGTSPLSVNQYNSSAADLQRLVPILTMLYSLFEWLHGDDSAHDRLLANGISMIKEQADVIPRLQLGYGVSPVDGVQDGPLDFRDGQTDFLLQGEDAASLIVRWAVLSWLQWPATTKSAAAVVQYYTWNLAENDVISGDLSAPLPPIPALEHVNYEKVCGIAMRMVTMVLVWFTRLRIDGIDEGIIGAVAGDEGPQLDKLRREQQVLEPWLRAWQQALTARTALETDPVGRMMLTEFVYGCKTLLFAVQVGVPAAPASPASSDGSVAVCGDIRYDETSPSIEDRSVEQARLILDEVDLRIQAKSARGEVGLGECNPTTLALVCRECRDIGVRARALTAFRWATGTSAFWGEQGSIMGTCALAALEEQSRDPVTGLIPREAQWRWVQASWADNHDVLDVVFKSVIRDESGNFRYKKARLSASDFGYAGRNE